MAWRVLDAETKNVIATGTLATCCKDLLVDTTCTVGNVVEGKEIRTYFLSNTGGDAMIFKCEMAFYVFSIIGDLKIREIKRELTAAGGVET